MKAILKFTPRLISLAGIIASIYLAVVLIQTVRHNASLKSQITLLEKDIIQLNEDNKELSFLIQYYQTDAFKEKEARAKLGLQKPGENLVILPRQQKQPEVATQEKAKAKPKTEPNWELWWHFLFG